MTIGTSLGKGGFNLEVVGFGARLLNSCQDKIEEE